MKVKLIRIKVVESFKFMYKHRNREGFEGLFWLLIFSLFFLIATTVFIVYVGLT